MVGHGQRWLNGGGLKVCLVGFVKETNNSERSCLVGGVKLPSLRHAPDPIHPFELFTSGQWYDD